MKNIYSLLLALVLLVGAGCSDRFIDPQPRVDLLIENYYQTEQQFFDALIASYDPLGWTLVDGAFVSNIMLGEIRSDNAKAGGDPSNGDQPGWQAIDDFLNSTLTIESEGFWKKGWWGIYRTNLIITSDALDTDNVRLYKAEAKFLRAWYHFYLFRVFGPVPIVDKLLTEADFLSVKRATVSELFAFIKSDLEEAIALLPAQKYTGSFAGRVSKTTAQALMGKVLLYEADILNDDPVKFAQAATYLKEVINSGQYRLLSDFKQLFAFGVKNSDESVFEIQYTNLVPHSWGDNQFIDGNMVVQLNGIRGLCADHPLYAPGWGFMLPTQSLYSHFLPDDHYRRDAAILSRASLIASGCNVDLAQINQEDFDGYFQIKYANFKAYSNPNGGDINLQKDPNEPVIRYADVLLMCAEALVRGGGSQGEAMTYVDLVRQRAAGPNAASYINTQQLMANQGWSLLDVIFYERRAELAIEGDRWFDLVRSGRVSPALFPNDYRAGNLDMSRLYLSIPQRDIDNTGGSLTAYPDASLFN